MKGFTIAEEGHDVLALAPVDFGAIVVTLSSGRYAGVSSSTVLS